MVKSEYCIKRPWPLASTISVSKQQNANHFQEVYLLWWKIVQAYSKCDLSHKEDKLVATYGLAKGACRALGGQDQYLAGLWRRDILNGLLWRKGGELRGCIPPKYYPAPSWSLASLNGPIYRPQTTNPEFYVTLVDAQLDYLTKNTFGQVKRGNIRLRGPLKTITFQKKSVDALDPILGELLGPPKFPPPQGGLPRPLTN